MATKVGNGSSKRQQYGHSSVTTTESTASRGSGGDSRDRINLTNGVQLTSHNIPTFMAEMGLGNGRTVVTYIHTY